MDEILKEIRPNWGSRSQNGKQWRRVEDASAKRWASISQIILDLRKINYINEIKKQKMKHVYISVNFTKYIWYVKFYRSYADL